MKKSICNYKPEDYWIIFILFDCFSTFWFSKISYFQKKFQNIYFEKNNWFNFLWPIFYILPMFLYRIKKIVNFSKLNKISINLQNLRPSCRTSRKMPEWTSHKNSSTTLCIPMCSKILQISNGTRNLCRCNLCHFYWWTSHSNDTQNFSLCRCRLNEYYSG